MPSVEETDIESFDELVRMFVDGFPSKIQQIERAVADTDIEKLSVLLHQLKGSAGSYGFSEVTELAAKARKTLLEADAINKATSSTITRLIDKCRTTDANNSELLKQ